MNIKAGDVFLHSSDYRGGADILINSVFIANDATMVDFDYTGNENLNTHCGGKFFIQLLRQHGFTPDPANYRRKPCP
ncbi:MAG: hypothetical protein WC551_08710 [Patescibacteria group bacterium]